MQGAALPPIRGSQPRRLKGAGPREVGGLEEGVVRAVGGALQREGQVGLLEGNTWKEKNEWGELDFWGGGLKGSTLRGPSPALEARRSRSMCSGRPGGCLRIQRWGSVTQEPQR